MPKELKTLSQTKQQEKDIIAFLKSYRNGGLLLEIADGFAELTEACMETGKAGQLKIEFGVRSASSDGAMEIGDVVTVKAPKLSKGTAIFFASPNGALTKSDPRQSEMDIKTIEHDDNGPVRTIGGMSDEPFKTV